MPGTEGASFPANLSGPCTARVRPLWKAISSERSEREIGLSEAPRRRVETLVTSIPLVSTSLSRCFRGPPTVKADAVHPAKLSGR
jgi:hypothetical protein